MAAWGLQGDVLRLLERNEHPSKEKEKQQLRLRQKANKLVVIIRQ